ncbi:MAG: hypothetical protein GXO77_09950 [Calditrichaeota bacterium]|nr:hypothetical protein [Calditrichota bacterium]
MERVKKYPLIFLIFFSLVNYLTGANFYHESPSQVYQGENIRLELKELSYTETIVPPTLFYRMTGEFDFHSLPLKSEGFVYYVEIPAKKLRPGKIQYYFAMQTPTGNVITYPEGAPFTRLYELEVLANNNNQNSKLRKIDINLLAPEENEILNPDELFFAFSIPLDIENPKELNFRITIDGIDHSSQLIREGHVISYTPRAIRSGLHQVSFKVYNAEGILVGQRQFRFRVSDMPSTHKAFSYKGSFFVDNRMQTVAQNDINYTRGGIRLNLNYKKFELETRLLMNSNESSDRQPLNIYSARLKYELSYKYFFYVWGGDVFPDYDPLVLQGRRIRGFSVGLFSKYFDFDYTQGQSARAIEGTTFTDDPSKILRYGTYKQDFRSIRPRFNFGSHFSWGLNLVNGKDNSQSIRLGGNPKEYLVLGTTLDLNFHDRRIIVHGSAQASIKNEDATGEVEFDSLANSLNLSDSDRKLARQIVDIFTKPGFLTLTPGLAPLPSLALQLDAQLRYFNNNLLFSYKQIDGNYKTPGNPFLLKDLAGLFINDYIRFLNNRFFLNVFFNLYETNRSQGKAKTRNKDIGATLSLTPQSNLPSFSLSYINYDRKNDVPETDSLLIPEDNITQSIGLSSSLNFTTGIIRNTVSVSANHFIRDDVFKTTQSQYNLLTVGIRNQFSFPLTSRFSYSKTTTDFGEGTAKTSTDIKRYTLGVEYLLQNFILDSQLRPFVRATFQTINNSAVDKEYKRQNFTTGFYLRTSKLGTLSLRYDYINYGNYRDYKDTIFSARYEVFF